MEQKKQLDPKTSGATELDEGQLEQSSGGADPINTLKRPTPRPPRRSTTDGRMLRPRNQESDMTDPKKQEEKTGSATELDEGQLEQSSGGSEPVNTLKRPPPRPAGPING